MNTKTNTAEVVVEQRTSLESLRASVGTRVNDSIQALKAGVVNRITVISLVTEAIKSGEISSVDEPRYRSHAYANLRKQVEAGVLVAVRGRTGGFVLSSAPVTTNSSSVEETSRV
jgi:hypothetical protein